MIFLSLLFLLVSGAWAKAPDLCDILELSNCDGISKQGRRASLLSVPTPSTAALLNPANVSFDRGFGIEAIEQRGNPTTFSLASGTGKLGGALINTSMENAFFGNRVFELDSVYLKRRRNKKQYKRQKLNLALGAKLYRSKNISFDFGLILKRHEKIKRLNPGAGLSLKLGPINLGASVYQDDFFLDYRNQIDPASGTAYPTISGKPTYAERFTVQTFSAGTKIYNLSFDAGFIRTRYEEHDEDTYVQLYTAAYTHENFRFIYGKRTEDSPFPGFKDGELDYSSRYKHDHFGSVQYSYNKHFIFGVNYNYFLLDELSLSATFFL